MTTLAVHLSGFAVCRIEPGWRLRVGRMEQITIHYVLEGHGAIRLEHGTTTDFAPRSVILVPAGQAQTLDCPDGRDDGGLRESPDDESCTFLADGLVAFRAGDPEGDISRTSSGGVTCVCGAITASFGGALGLLEGLRDPIIVAMAADDQLRSYFDAMLSELSRPSFGTRALTEAMMKVCLVTILRRQLVRPGADRPILAALGDRRLAAAVAAIVNMPAGPHTVASLAEVAGMSRTAFAQHFAETYGRTPIDFLQTVRLRHAAHHRRSGKGDRWRRRLSQPIAILPGVPDALRTRPVDVPTHEQRRARGGHACIFKQDIRWSDHGLRAVARIKRLLKELVRPIIGAGKLNRTNGLVPGNVAKSVQ